MASSSVTLQQQYTALYEKVKPIIWVIRVTGRVRKMEEPVVRRGTAFSVTNDGRLLTCAHIFDGLIVSEIVVRRLDMDGLMSTVNVIDLRPNWDLCLLKVGGIVGCESGNLVTNGSLREGEILLCIANPQECVGSFGLSHVLFRCVEDVLLPSPHGRRSTCSQYDHYPSSMDVTPGYRIMGHIWNRTSIRRNETAGLITKDNYRGKLHPSIPIIQCGDICVGEGSAGGPIFNTRGEVVGILASHDMNDQIGIHITLIREYLREALES